MKAGRRCAAGKEEEQFNAASEANLLTSPDDCAADIIAGLERGKQRILTGHKSTTLFWINRLLPNSYPRLMRLL